MWLWTFSMQTPPLAPALMVFRLTKFIPTSPLEHPAPHQSIIWLSLNWEDALLTETLPDLPVQQPGVGLECREIPPVKSASDSFGTPCLALTLIFGRRHVKSNKKPDSEQNVPGTRVLRSPCTWLVVPALAKVTRLRKKEKPRKPS